MSAPLHSHPGVIDAGAFPHILTRVRDELCGLDPRSALRLRAVSTAWNEHITDALLDRVRIAPVQQQPADEYDSDDDELPFTLSAMSPDGPILVWQQDEVHTAGLQPIVANAIRAAAVLDIYISDTSIVRLDRGFDTSLLIVAFDIVIDCRRSPNAPPRMGARLRTPLNTYPPPDHLVLHIEEEYLASLLATTGGWTRLPAKITILYTVAELPPPERDAEANERRIQWLPEVSSGILSLGCDVTIVSPQAEEGWANPAAVRYNPFWVTLKTVSEFLQQRSGAVEGQFSRITYLTAMEYISQVGVETYALYTFMYRPLHAE